MLSCARPVLRVFRETRVMAKRTCAACDCELDDNPIQVKIRGRTVEVCCDECAIKLKEAQAFAEPGASPRAER
jgi:hypothetical protein